MHKAPSERDMQLLKMPTIESQFPVRFPTGSEWRQLTGTCSGCGQKLEGDRLHGAVTMQGPHTAVVDAVGVCHECKLITRYFYRLHDDSRITGLKDGQWRTWQLGSPMPNRSRLAMAWAGFLVPAVAITFADANQPGYWIAIAVAAVPLAINAFAIFRMLR